MSGECNCTCQIAGAHDPDCATWGPPQEPPDAAVGAGECEICATEREECDCWEWGDEDGCTRCGGSGSYVPMHCCQCGGGEYDCTCCSQCGAYVGTCGCKIEIATHDGGTISV